MPKSTEPEPRPAPRPPRTPRSAPRGCPPPRSVLAGRVSPRLRLLADSLPTLGAECCSVFTSPAPCASLCPHTVPNSLRTSTEEGGLQPRLRKPACPPSGARATAIPEVTRTPGSQSPGGAQPRQHPCGMWTLGLTSRHDWTEDSLAVPGGLPAARSPAGRALQG